MFGAPGTSANLSPWTRGVDLNGLSALTPTRALVRWGGALVSLKREGLLWITGGVALERHANSTHKETA
jgi:hypothetical protein